MRVLAIVAVLMAGLVGCTSGDDEVPVVDPRQRPGTGHAVRVPLETIPTGLTGEVFPEDHGELIGVGAATGVAEAASVLRVNQTKKLDTTATILANAYKNASTPESKAIKLNQLANAAIEAERFRVAAEGNLVSRFEARQPQWLNTMFTKPLVGGIPKPKARRLVPKPPGPKPSAWLRAKDGAKALGRVPLIGIGLAALGVGLEIASGTDPVKAVASGAAGVVGGVVGGVLVGSVASGAVEQAFG